MTSPVARAAPALRAVALGALGAALLTVAVQTAWEGRSRLLAHAADAAERRIATTAAAMAGALSGSAAARTSPAQVARAAGAGTVLAEVRLGRPDEEDGYWEVASDARGGPWHAPLPGRLFAASHAAAWGSAVVGEIGLAGGSDARWAYARPGGAAATLIVGIQDSPGQRDAPAQGPWLALLLVGMASAAAGAWLAAARLGERAARVEALREVGLAAAVGRAEAMPPGASDRLVAVTASLRDALARVLVTGAASDTRLEAHRRRRELVRALGWQVRREDSAPDAWFAAGWPGQDFDRANASGWVRRPAGDLAWLVGDDREPLAAAARHAGLAAISERALAAEGTGPALREALRPLVGTEVDGFVWSVPGSGCVQVLGHEPRAALGLGADGRRRAILLPASGEVALAPGETLLLASGPIARVEALLSQLAEAVSLPRTDAAQLVALLVGAADQQGDGEREARGLFVALAAPGEPGVLPVAKGGAA